MVEPALSVTDVTVASPVVLTVTGSPGDTFLALAAGTTVRSPGAAGVPGELVAPGRVWPGVLPDQLPRAGELHALSSSTPTAASAATVPEVEIRVRWVMVPRLGR